MKLGVMNTNTDDLILHQLKFILDFVAHEFHAFGGTSRFYRSEFDGIGHISFEDINIYFY